MSKTNHPEMFKKNIDIDLKQCSLIGEGNNGWVYLMPDGRVIKICREIKSCVKEYYILKKVNGSHHFPRVYEQCGNYMIRDYVGGVCMTKYIKKNGLSKNLAVNLIKLIEEFKRLNFSKLDIRCRDLFVQENDFIMVIDPRSSYTRNVAYPRHMMKGLKRLGVLDTFMKVLKEENPGLYKNWRKEIAKNKTAVEKE